MQTILEVRPSGRTLYTMPEPVFNIVRAMLQTWRFFHRQKVSVADVIERLGPALRQRITVEPLPDPNLQTIPKQAFIIEESAQ